MHGWWRCVNCVINGIIVKKKYLKIYGFNQLREMQEEQLVEHLHTGITKKISERFINLIR